MSGMEISQVLAQIRALSAQAGTGVRSAAQVIAPPGGTVTPAGTATSAATPAFGDLLKQGIDAVNQSQQTANALQDAWERGDSNVDLGRVMVATEKASVSLQALSQVRNRLVSVYQDIMNMSI